MNAVRQRGRRQLDCNRHRRGGLVVCGQRGLAVLEAEVIEVFNSADLAAATERLSAEQQAITESMLELERRLGCTQLDEAALSGLTQERWAKLRVQVGVLWTRFNAYQTAMERIRQIRSRRSHPTKAELRELEAILAGAPAVTIPQPTVPFDRRDLTTAAASAPHHETLDQVVAEMTSAYAQVRDTVMAVEEIYIALLPAVEQCGASLRRAQAQVVELQLTPDTDPAASELAHADHELAELGRRLRTDPLSLQCDGAVDRAGVDDLADRCNRIGADLTTLTQLRDHAPSRLAQVTATIEDIGRVAEETENQQRHAQAKIHEPELPARRHPRPLRGQLAEVQSLLRQRRWRAVSTGLAALERAAELEQRRCQVELADARRPLQHRAELRGRLAAYRAKAASRGQVEELAQRHRRAHDLLWNAPCDLRAAHDAVRAYQRAVTDARDDEETP